MPTQQSEQKLVQTWISVELAEQLRARADIADRSIAAETRQAIRQYLRNSEAALTGGSTKTRMAVRNGSRV